MATTAPAPATSDAADPLAEDLPQTKAATATEPEDTEGDAASAVVSGGASNPSAVVVAAVTEGELPGEAVTSTPAPAPDPASSSSSAALPPPASPATHAAPGPPRPQFADSPVYMATPRPVPSPSPAFSYNVLPMAPPPLLSGSGLAPHQPASSLVGVLSSAAAVLYLRWKFPFPCCVSEYNHILSVLICQ
jgi:transcription elongation regulator 1